MWHSTEAKWTTTHHSYSTALPCELLSISRLDNTGNRSPSLCIRSLIRALSNYTTLLSRKQDSTTCGVSLYRLLLPHTLLSRKQIPQHVASHYTDYSCQTVPPYTMTVERQGDRTSWRRKKRRKRGIMKKKMFLNFLHKIFFLNKKSGFLMKTHTPHIKLKQTLNRLCGQCKWQRVTYDLYTIHHREPLHSHSVSL